MHVPAIESLPRARARAIWPALGRVALVTAAALTSLAASWQDWIDPFVDSGRELNLPLRLAAGERLYRDAVFYYGPAGPWLQALALRLCGGRPCRSWLPLEAACLLLAAAILILLYRLTAAAGGTTSALAATAFAAACCLGGPRRGAFIFPYSASSLYALAGALLALTASLSPPSWRRRVAVAGGLALALAARIEIGGAALLILAIAAWRSQSGRGSRENDAAPPARAEGSAPEDQLQPATGPRESDARDLPAARRQAETFAAPSLLAPSRASMRQRHDTRDGAPSLGRGALGDLALGAAVAAAAWWAAVAGISWRALVAEGPLTHLLAMPPPWQRLYGTVSGLGHLDRSLWTLAAGVAIDALLLGACALPIGGGAGGSYGPGSSDGPGGSYGLGGSDGPAMNRPRRWPLLCSAVAFGAIAGVIACYGTWAGPLGLPWSRTSSNLPPLLFPLPLVAALATLVTLRRPLDERGRARFMLFVLAAALGARVVLGFDLGPQMAYCALPLPPLAAAAAVLAGDVLAPRLRHPGTFRRRLAAIAVGFAALFLFRLGALAWGPHSVRLETPAGSLRLPWQQANAVTGTLDYLAGRARPGDALAGFPEGGFFNFTTGMRNPLREDQIFPGVLDSEREAAAVARLLADPPRFVLLANRPTSEYGARAFGKDYAVELWSAVASRYSLAASLGNAREDAPIGARRFFIRVYELVPASGK